MRVVSLLPAATEIVAALGGAGSLVGISHECDHPASVLGLPRVTGSPIDPEAPGAVIDAEVRRLHAAGTPVIGVDARVLRELAPDLIITQALCEVCAVADGEVHRLGAGRQPSPAVLSLSGRDTRGDLVGHSRRRPRARPRGRSGRAGRRAAQPAGPPPLPRALRAAAAGRVHRMARAALPGRPLGAGDGGGRRRARCRCRSGQSLRPPGVARGGGPRA